MPKSLYDCPAALRSLPVNTPDRWPEETWLWPVACLHTLPPRDASVATARLLVRTALAGREPGQIDDALLVVSELMTNAIREATQPVELRIGTATERVRLTVTDCSPGEPCLRDASPDSDHGRGLYLVDAIAESWGWVPGAAGKTVWAEL